MQGFDFSEQREEILKFIEEKDLSQKENKEHLMQKLKRFFGFAVIIDARLNQMDKYAKESANIFFEK